MSEVPGELPKDLKSWEEDMAAMDLTGQTIHGAELESASKISISSSCFFRFSGCLTLQQTCRKYYLALTSGFRRQRHCYGITNRGIHTASDSRTRILGKGTS